MEYFVESYIRAKLLIYIKIQTCKNIKNFELSYLHLNYQIISFEI